jgi:hypothetical protein
MPASMELMEALVTIWLPVLGTAVVAWRLHRRRPETLAPGLRALERLIGSPAELPEPVRLVPRPRPDLRIVRDEDAA